MSRSSRFVWAIFGVLLAVALVAINVVRRPQPVAPITVPMPVPSISYRVVAAAPAVARAIESSLHGTRRRATSSRPPVSRPRSVAFANGAEVAIDWRPRLSPGYEIWQLSNDTVRSFIERSAAGDADASFELYRLAVWCDDFSLVTVRTSEVLTGQPLKAWNTFGLRPRGRRPRTVACSVLEDEASLDKDKLYELALEQGSTDLLLRKALEDFPSAESVKALERAWLAGDARAAALLARAHRTGWTDNDTHVLPDDSVALAYDIIATELVPFVSESGFDQRLYEEMVAQTEEFARGMSPISIESSVDTAQVLLETNENCCVRPVSEGAATD